MPGRAGMKQVGGGGRASRGGGAAAAGRGAAAGGGAGGESSRGDAERPAEPFTPPLVPREAPSAAVISPGLHSRRPAASSEQNASSAASSGKNIWGTARGVFVNAMLSQPEVEALREGERVLGESDVQIIKRRDSASEARVGEEKQFSMAMHEEWAAYLQEEILLLRIERQNELLERQQLAPLPRRPQTSEGTSSSSSSRLQRGGGFEEGREEGVSALTRHQSDSFDLNRLAPDGPTSDEYSSSVSSSSSSSASSTSSTSAANAAAGLGTKHSSADKPKARGKDRWYPSRAFRSQAMPSLSELSDHFDTVHSLNSPSSLISPTSLMSPPSLTSPPSLPSHPPPSSSFSSSSTNSSSWEFASTLSNDQHEASFICQKASNSSAGDSSTSISAASGSGASSIFSLSHSASAAASAAASIPLSAAASGPEGSWVRHRRGVSIGTPEELRVLSEEAMVRGINGVRAAKAAAATAVTGGKRIVRMWQRVKKIIPSGDEEGGMEPTPSVSSSAASLAASLLAGEISSRNRGHAWVAIACSDPEDDIMNRANYRKLLQQPAPYADEIELDISRTFPADAMFAAKNGAGQQALFNVMKAYSVFDKEVGYCQGMAFITAILILNVPEEDAFCCLVFLMQRCGLRGVFMPDMEQLQLRLYQLSQLVFDALPAVHSFFEEHDIKPVMYAADWFLTLFARTMPNYIVLRVFDIIFAEKTGAIIFKLALVLLQMCRRQLMQCPEMEYCMHFIRTELPEELSTLSDADLEEIVAKALRADLPFESLLRLEAEYELLAGEAVTAAREVQAAAVASEAAAASWEKSREELEARLMSALQSQQLSNEKVERLMAQMPSSRGIVGGTEEVKEQREDLSAGGKLVEGRRGSSRGQVEEEEEYASERRRRRWRSDVLQVVKERAKRAGEREGGRGLNGREGNKMTEELQKVLVELRRQQEEVGEELVEAEKGLMARICFENEKFGASAGRI